ncbi:MAG: hypothetical protein ACYC6W_10210 [Nitrosotalea sp.]
MKDNIQLEFNISESRTGVDVIADAHSKILPLDLSGIPSIRLKRS